jgi:hypothetical protein
MTELTKLELESRIVDALDALPEHAYAVALYVAVRDLEFMYDEWMSDRVRDLTERTAGCLRLRAMGETGPGSTLADEWASVCDDDDEDGPSGYGTMMIVFAEIARGISAPEHPREELQYLGAAVGAFPTIAGLWAPVILVNPQIPADETEYGVRMLRRLESAVPTIRNLAARGVDPETVRSDHLPPAPEPPVLRAEPTLEQHCVIAVAQEEGALAGLVPEFVGQMRWAMLGERSSVTDLSAETARTVVTRLEPVVEQMVADGRVHLCEPAGAAGELRRLTGRSIRQALADPDAWLTCDGAHRRVHLVTTDRGKQT